eukprot:5047703-Prorocentrum_lima.AAC.1
MTSSLVGSEMCIRDRKVTLLLAQAREEESQQHDLIYFDTMHKGCRNKPVSYTHLTLPTICSV